MSKLRTREIFENSTLSLIAVERVDTQHQSLKNGCHWYASIAPIAVIVHSEGETYALDTAGSSIDLKQLERDLGEFGISIR